MISARHALVSSVCDDGTMSSSEKSLSRLIAVVILNHHQVQQMVPRYALRTKRDTKNKKGDVLSSFYCFKLFESLVQQLRGDCGVLRSSCDEIKKPARGPHILVRNIREIGYRP